MKPVERESFLKSLLLYFLTIELLIVLLIHHSYREDALTLRQQLFLQMKNYSYSFEGEKFSLDFISKKSPDALLELHENPQELYTIFPLQGNEWYNLKIYYPRSAFAAQTSGLLRDYALALAGLSFAVGLIALGFARYTLRPLRDALALTDRFIKDIIHDLNTPVSAILINTSMLPRGNKATERIEKSAQIISMLHRNLQEYQGGLPRQRATLRLDTLVQERSAFFRGLYPDLKVHSAVEPTEISAHPDAIRRIIDNLLSNACKYNAADGEVSLTLFAHILRIENTVAHPIKSPEKLFDRFYKESERGIGIGLHIVKKLCDEEQINITVSQDNGRALFALTFPRTLSASI